MTTPLHDAAEAGDVQELRHLIEMGFEIDALNRFGQTAVMRAAHAGHTDAVIVLCTAGAQLDVHAKYGLTALMLAVIGAHSETALALVAGGAATTPVGTGAPAFEGRRARDLAAAQGLTAVVDAIDRAERDARPPGTIA